ncbi:Insulin protein enhancer protein isl-1 [Porites harrisoni]
MKGFVTGMEGIATKEKRRISMCVGCGSQIQDQYILRVAPDLEWHAGCLKCADCHTYLDETCTCFVRDGKTYCKRDYVRLFGTKCAKCSRSVTKNDFVMRAKSQIYHIDCFRCIACSRQLVPGDEFALREDGLFCKEDNEIVEKATATAQAAHVRGSQRSSSQSSAHSNGQTEESSPRRGKSSEKTTRVRTVLNEKQLHTLRTCYAANPRPDAMMKEQLVEMTGLSPRVIRVWFQNKRCKDKKKSMMLNKTSSHHQHQGPGSDDGQSPTGSSPNALPSRTLPPSAISGVQVFASSLTPPSLRPPSEVSMGDLPSYQPWKALNEFAMHNDMDQGPFQQLVQFSEQAPHMVSRPHEGIGAN